MRTRNNLQSKVLKLQKQRENLNRLLLVVRDNDRKELIARRLMAIQNMLRG